MIRYVFKEGPLTIRSAAKADPQKIGEALAKLTTADGNLDVRVVPDAARDKRNYLNRFFEWDDEKAAKEYRVDQARELVRSIQVVQSDNTRPRPAYISIQGKDDGRAYRTLSAIENNLSLQVRLYEMAKRELESFAVRFQRMTSVVELIKPAIEATDAYILAAAQTIKNDNEDAA